MVVLGVVWVCVFCSAGFGGPQVLEVSPRYLEFTGYEGGANPAAQVLSIWNSGHGPMDWEVLPDCNWITVAPNSGTSSGEVDDANVIVDINGLAEGTYNCQLTVTGSGAPNSPQIVDVNLVVYELVSWWKFDEGSGTIAYDSAGGNDGTIYGATRTSGQVGGALSFDGSNDYVEVVDPADESLDFGSGNFTISLRFRTADTNGELVDKSGGNKGRSIGYSIYIGTYATMNDGEIGWRVADGTSRDLIKTDNTYNDGSWHHLAAVRTGTGSANLNIYVDGADVSTSSLLDEGAVGISNSYDLSIGAKYDGGDTNVWENFLNGVINDVRIYERALSVEEIAQLWSEGFGGRAFNPGPSNGMIGVDVNAVLSWWAGAWAADVNGHDVYFGTDYNDVNEATTTSSEYMGNQDTNSWSTADYDPCGLTYGTWCYWRIDEVNESYIPGPVPAPPNGRWKGDVWSFRVEGPAYDPVPSDGETDVAFLGLSLEWTAWADAEEHVVYFGTDAQAVSDATTSSDEYKTTLGIGTESWDVPGSLTVGLAYYWRIDEKSAGGTHTVKGDVWSFVVGPLLVVDDFESYASQTDLWNVWDDYWVNGYDGEIFLETNPDYIRQPGSQAAKLRFTNVDTSGGKLIGSQFDVQDMTDLDIGSDWTIGGVKALFMYVRGDPCNAQVVPLGGDKAPRWNAATPWIELEDTSSNVGYVVHPNPDQMSSDSWDEWNIDLSIFDACGVTLSAIDRFTIGIGGLAKTGQMKMMYGPGHIWVDDIRLYPPRCIPEMSELVGDFTADCSVDYFDVNVMAADWLIADGCVVISQRDGTLTMAGGDPNWTAGQIDGALGFDPNIKVDVNDPCLAGLTSMSITGWVKRGQLPAFVYTGIVNSLEDGKYTGVGVYSLGVPVYLCWGWNESGNYTSDLDVPGGTWTFVAMVAEATGCTLYMKPDGGTLDSERDSRTLGPLEQFDENFFIGRGDEDSSFFRGAIDDVRIYTYALDVNEITYLATEGVDGNEPDPNCPAYHYKFDDGSGLVALDSGCGASVYYPPMSPANLTDPEPEGSRFVNFHDYGILADNWMAQDFWP